MSGVVVWFTGLPCSGKSTLAEEVQRRLIERSVLPCLLDGDVMRRVLAPHLGYTKDARLVFYTSLADLAAELARQGLVVLVPATAHRREYRERARERAPRFIEVWVTASLAECERRDRKGLYGAPAGERQALPGVGVPYEAPENADVKASGGHDSWALEQILALLTPELSAAHDAPSEARELVT